MAYFLGIETSCDETAAAVFTEDLRVLANVVASQTDLHARFGGVVPEVAARAHLQRLLPVVDEALRQAGIRLEDLDCIAVLNTPGLVGALLVGVSAAKMLSVALNVPLVAANHVEAHIFAGRMAAGREIFPCLGLVISGGHTALFDCMSPLDFTLLGGTIDDAAGEAFDKVAALLGLGFPGGPAVERMAMLGNASAYSFPRSFLHEDRLDFSFSGLKTAVLYAVHGQDTTKPRRPLEEQVRANAAASFQKSVVDVLVAKTRQALRKTGHHRLAVGGGVAANRALRAGFEAMAVAEKIDLVIPPLEWCTDNAAMAALAVERWRREDWAPLDLDVRPTHTPGGR